MNTRQSLGGQEMQAQITSIAEERYKDLQDYLGAPYIYEPILENRENFKAWLERSVDAVRKLDRLEQKLEELEQGPRWIPVSKRLPEEETDVLVCNADGDIEISRGSYSTEVENDYIWYTSGWRFGEVIAWMPLPKPYKESEEY